MAVAAFVATDCRGIMVKYRRFGMMSSQKLAVLLSLLMLVSFPGCSGSRLRDLLPGGNDFVSLEDLEREEAAAQSKLASGGPAADESTGPFGKAKSLFVSRSKDASANSEESQSRGPLGLGKLLSGSADSALQPDPFLGISSEVSGTTTEEIRTAQAESSQVTPQVDPYSMPATDLVAESAAPSIPDGTEEALAEAFAEFTSDSGETVEPSVTPASASTLANDEFASFLDAEVRDEAESPAPGNQDRIRAAVAAFGMESSEFDAAADNVAATGKEFATETQSRPSAQFDEFEDVAVTSADDRVDVVPGFDGLLTDSHDHGVGDTQATAEQLLLVGAGSPAADSAFDDLSAGPQNPADRSLDQSSSDEDLFARAAARHGFAEDGEASDATDATDVWSAASVAAFDWQRPVDQQEQAASVSLAEDPWHDPSLVAAADDAEGSVPDFEAAFIEVNESDLDDVSVEAPEPAGDKPWGTMLHGEEQQGAAVAQVSSSREVTQDMADDSFFDQAGFAGASSATSPASVLVTDTCDAIGSGRRPAESLLNGRTWFLLVGALAVVALLFFPERRRSR